MAQTCPHCGAQTPDDLPFCSSCGEPVQADLRLIMDMQNAAGRRQEAASSAASRKDDDDFQLNTREEERSFPWLPVALILLGAGILLWILLK